MSSNTILVLDFGGQYAHLIARRIRELKVYSEVGPGDLSSREFEELKEDLNIKGVILSGGPSSVYNEKSPKIDRKILKHSIPFLGLCYGHQLIAFISGGKVKPGKKHEYGISEVRINNSQGI